MTATNNVTPNARNLRGLCALRSVVLLGQFVAAHVAQAQLGWMLPYLTLNLLFTAMAGLAAFSWWRSFQRWPVTDLELFVHLCVDLFGFSAVLYFSGGANNPFISYLLVPLCISATTLPWRFTWGLTVLGLATYALLLFYFVPLVALAPHQGHQDTGPNIHILGMFANFTVSALLITYFVFKMASALRQREEELARSRERLLQDEQLLAVATLAAGTAHELGTPLATMKVITEDLEEWQHDPALKEDLRSLNQQIDHCKQILSKLVATARDFSSGEPHRAQLGDYFPALLDRWQLLRPGQHIALTLDSTLETLQVELDGTVSQAILNLLNNAADAASQDLHLSVSRDEKDLLIFIADRGQGLPAEVGRPGRAALISNKQDGLGLGLLLSHATADRYGGSLRWQAREGGGSEVCLRLPLARLEVNR